MTYLTFFLALFSISMSAAAQLLLKKGLSANGVSGALEQHRFPDFFMLIAGTPWVPAGLFLYVLSMACWIGVLTKTEVSIAYPLVGIGFILTALIAWLWLGESLTPHKIVGIALIISGVYALTRPGA